VPELLVGNQSLVIASDYADILWDTICIAVIETMAIRSSLRRDNSHSKIDVGAPREIGIICSNSNMLPSDL
jgi:hypothetical protein